MIKTTIEVFYPKKGGIHQRGPAYIHFNMQRSLFVSLCLYICSNKFTTETKLKSNSLTSSFNLVTTGILQQTVLVLGSAMPLCSVAPKPDDGPACLPSRTEACNTSYLAYPMQKNSQSFLQRTSYPITIKVSLSLSLICIQKGSTQEFQLKPRHMVAGLHTY